MAKLYNLARMTTATTGTGTITLGAAVSGYLTFALAGVADGDIVDYAIKDGVNSENGTGTYTASGTTLSRTVTKSTTSNTAISLSGFAEVFISPRAETLNDASLFVGGLLADARLNTTIVAGGPTGDASHVAQVTYDAHGRLTTVTAVAIAIGAGAVSGLAAVATSGSASDLTTGTLPLAQRGYAMPDVIVEEQLASGTNAGIFTAGSYVQRALNTVVRNAGSIASLASNQVTLGAGTYHLAWSSPGVNCAQHKTRLVNASTAGVVGVGTTEFSSTGGACTRSVGSAVVTIGSSNSFSLQHRCTSTEPTNGLGIFAAYGDVEVYSRLEITKLA
jgi:hypothetical protein